MERVELQPRSALFSAWFVVRNHPGQAAFYGLLLLGAVSGLGVRRYRHWQRMRKAHRILSLDAQDRAPEALQGCRLGRYRILNRIGRGGMGIVYRAQLESEWPDGPQLAIKVLRTPFVKDGDYVSRLAREARVGSRLKHPGLVAVSDHGRLGRDLHYIVMEHVAGTPLSERLQQSGHRLHISTALDYLEQLLNATWYAHQRGVIHRDLKPSTVIIQFDGTLKIVDFGIARELDDTARMTVSVGTPYYMAPELLSGQPATPAGDQ